MLKNIVLPLISLAVGLISVFIDAKSNKVGATVAVLVLAASAILTGYFGLQDDNAAAAQAALQGKELAILTELAQHDGLLLQNEGDTTQPQTGISLRLDEQPRPAEAEGAPVVQYFAKSAEGDSVTTALQRSGFRVVRVPAQFPGEATNAIWIGDAVPIEYARKVALSLLETGVRLRGIYRFRDGSGPRSNLIEVGSSARLNPFPVLTKPQIESMPIRPQN